MNKMKINHWVLGYCIFQQIHLDVWSDKICFFSLAARRLAHPKVLHLIIVMCHVATDMKIGEKSSAKLKQVLHLCIHVDMKRYYTESTWLHCTQIFPTPPLQGTLCHCNLKLARLDHFISV